MNINQNALNLVWAAVTQNPRATNEELAHGTALPYGMVRTALEQLQAMGHIGPDPLPGEARYIRVKMTYGPVSRQGNSVRIGNVDIPILGEIGDGPDGQPVVRFYGE
jgi:hypothetical protein